MVLAAGPIETPRLWLNSGLPNPNDEVGRGLTDHYLDFVVGRAEKRLLVWRPTQSETEQL